MPEISRSTLICICELAEKPQLCLAGVSSFVLYSLNGISPMDLLDRFQG
jgi:hypothetical protein